MPRCGRKVESLLAPPDIADFLQKAVGDAANTRGSQPAGHELMPRSQLGPYKIISCSAPAAWAKCYLPKTTTARRKVALKMITPDLIQDERGLRRFEHEAHAASALNHPNILTIYEFGQADGFRFIACEFIEGVTLRSRKLLLASSNLVAAIDIVIQMAGALAPHTMPESFTAISNRRT